MSALSIPATSQSRAFDARQSELRAARADQDRAHEDERRAQLRSEDADKRVDRAERAAARRKVDCYA
jgi:hypothetical protein